MTSPMTRDALFYAGRPQDTSALKTCEQQSISVAFTRYLLHRNG